MSELEQEAEAKAEEMPEPTFSAGASAEDQAKIERNEAAQKELGKIKGSPKVRDLIKVLKKFPANDLLVCQVTAQNGKAYNMGWNVFNDSKSIGHTFLSLSRPELKHLPDPIEWSVASEDGATKEDLELFAKALKYTKRKSGKSLQVLEGKIAEQEKIIESMNKAELNKVGDQNTVN